MSIDVVGNIAINANYASTGETSSSKPKKSLCHIKMPERKTETPTHVSSVICCLDSYDNLILITTCTDYDYLNSISNSTATTNGLGVGFETPTANNVRSVNMTIPASHACGVSYRHAYIFSLYSIIQIYAHMYHLYSHLRPLYWSQMEIPTRNPT